MKTTIKLRDVEGITESIYQDLVAAEVDLKDVSRSDSDGTTLYLEGPKENLQLLLTAWGFNPNAAEEPKKEEPKKVEAKWTKETIIDKLNSSDQWVRKAISVLFSYQTDREQARGVTEEHNGKGFNGVDAPFASSLATQIAAGRLLSPKQMAVARKMLKKYAGQLALIANGAVK